VTMFQGGQHTISSNRPKTGVHHQRPDFSSD
jgi:hypothetical protein